MLDTRAYPKTDKLTKYPVFFLSVLFVNMDGHTCVESANCCVTIYNLKKGHDITHYEFTVIKFWCLQKFARMFGVSPVQVSLPPVDTEKPR